YGYLASSPQQLSGPLPDPSKLVGPVAKQYDVALTINPGYINRTYGAVLSSAGLAQLVGESQEVTVGLQISRKTRSAVVDINLRANRDTTLANALDGLNRGKNRFAYLQDPRSAVNLAVTIHPNQALRAIFLSMIEEARVQALAEGANVPVANDESV